MVRNSNIDDISDSILDQTILVPNRARVDINDIPFIRPDDGDAIMYATGTGYPSMRRRFMNMYRNAKRGIEFVYCKKKTPPSGTDDHKSDVDAEYYLDTARYPSRKSFFFIAMKLYVFRYFEFCKAEKIETPLVYIERCNLYLAARKRHLASRPKAPPKANGDTSFQISVNDNSPPHEFTKKMGLSDIPRDHDTFCNDARSVSQASSRICKQLHKRIEWMTSGTPSEDRPDLADLLLRSVQSPEDVAIVHEGLEAMKKFADMCLLILSKRSS